jgi:hypothetical protein
MEDKLICAMLSNIKDVTFRHGNFWLKTNKDYIRIIQSQKYIFEKVETRKGNFFMKPIYVEQYKYLQEWTYELIFQNYEFNIDGSVYDKIKKKRNKYLSKQINKELDALCKSSENE